LHGHLAIYKELYVEWHSKSYTLNAEGIKCYKT